MVIEMNEKAKPTVVELNASIYNDLVKVFNDASNGFVRMYYYAGKCGHNYPKTKLLLDHELKKLRNEVIEFRKQFPTYQELKDSGIRFADGPSYIDNDGFLKEAVSWQSGNANILEQVDVLYEIGFVRGVDPETRNPTLHFKVRGTKKGFVPQPNVTH